MSLLNLEYEPLSPDRNVRLQKFYFRFGVCVHSSTSGFVSIRLCKCFSMLESMRGFGISVGDWVIEASLMNSSKDITYLNKTSVLISAAALNSVILGNK